MAGGGLLERSRQLDELDDALRTVIDSGRGRVALVAGEPGIGKTALLRQFCADSDEAAQTVWTGCEPLFTPKPLGPVFDLAEAIGGGLAALAADHPAPYDVAVALLRQLASAPSVLVVDDLHWADEATLDVLRVIARRVASAPVLLVLSYRDSELDETHPLRVVLGDLPGADRVTRLELCGLSPQAVADLADPAGLDAAWLYELTSGNPFYVTEVLAAGADMVPRSVRDAVLARTARLDGEARRLLAALAVVPGSAERWLVAALAPGAVEKLDECADAGMVLLDGERIAFRHEIARRAVEQSLPPGRQTALHLTALRALSAPPSGEPDLARLAHHAAAAGDAKAVLRYVPAAADRAAALGARREATALYARALRFAGSMVPAERAGLLESFADAAYFTGESQDGAKALREAAEIHARLGNPLRQGDVLRRLGLHLWKDGAFAAAKEALTEAVRLLGQRAHGSELARAYSVLALVLGTLGEGHEADRIGQLALDLAERAGCTDALADTLNVVGIWRAQAGDYAGLAMVDRSRELARRGGDETGVARAYLHPGLLLAARREWELVERYAAPGREFCAERGFDRWYWELTALLARAAVAMGRWSEAMSIAEEILVKPTTRFPDMRVLALMVLGRARMRSGKQDYRPLFDEAARIERDSPFQLALLDLAAALAEAAWLEGAPREQIQRDLGIAPVGDAMEIRWLAGEAGVWQYRAGLDCGDSASFADPYRLEVTGDAAGAAQWWLDRGCQYDAALTLAFAAMRDAKACPEDLAMLRRAHRLLSEAGARPAAAVVARKLRTQGVRDVPRGPNSVNAANPVGLTSREIEVLRLVAAGLSNPEIAAKLGVSDRTVDHHATAIYRKTGTPNRAAASAEAFRLGFIS